MFKNTYHNPFFSYFPFVTVIHLHYELWETGAHSQSAQPSDEIHLHAFLLREAISL
jgi:hypothetical protein